MSLTGANQGHSKALTQLPPTIPRVTSVHDFTRPFIELKREWGASSWVPDGRIVFWMGAWYLCSLMTLFLNKEILNMGGNIHILGLVQMTMTATLGAAKVYGGRILGSLIGARVAPDSAVLDPREPHTTFWRDMVLVGAMRGGTVLLGLLSLSHVAVSFTETIKSSAPFFTVIFSQLILGQKTTTKVRPAHLIE